MPLQDMHSIACNGSIIFSSRRVVRPLVPMYVPLSRANIDSSTGGRVDESITPKLLRSHQIMLTVFSSVAS